MNNLILRSSLTLACALSLASCGGSDGNLQIGVYVINMTKPGMVLKEGGQTREIPQGAAGSSQLIYFEGYEADDRFSIQVENQPAGSACVGFNNVGKMGGYSVANVEFRCYNLPQILSGRLNAPLDSPITLNNGNTQLVVPAGQTEFAFTTKDADGKTIGTVGNGDPFGVTVLVQPTGKTCTVIDGSGIMGLGYDKVTVTCQ